MVVPIELLQVVSTEQFVDTSDYNGPSVTPGLVYHSYDLTTYHAVVSHQPSLCNAVPVLVFIRFGVRWNVND